jgi:hypothetical protein
MSRRKAEAGDHARRLVEAFFDKIRSVLDLREQITVSFSPIVGRNCLQTLQSGVADLSP